MLTRVHVERVLEGWDDEVTYRICEASGTLCDCWLPGVENPDPEAPLDRGGFDLASDAQSFALGVDRERAHHGLLSVTVEAIDRERAALDWTKKGRPRTLDDFAANAVAKLEQLDFGSVIVERRRVA